MAAGDFPKIDGETLYGLDVNMLYDGIVQNASTTIINTINGERMDSTQLLSIPTYPNIVFDSLIDEGKVQTSTNLTYDSGKDLYYSLSATATYQSNTFITLSTVDFGTMYLIYDILPLIDNFSDASIDANIWTATTTNSSTITETSGELFFVQDQSSDDCYATADQVNAPDMFEKNAIMSCDITITANPGVVGSVEISIGNVVIKDFGDATITKTKFFFEVDGTRKRAREIGGTWVDISSVATNWFWRFGSNSTGTSTDCEFSVDNFYCYVLGDTINSSVVISASSDGGSNFNTMTQSEPVNLTNTSNDVELKAVFTQASDELFIMRGVGMLHN